MRIKVTSSRTTGILVEVISLCLSLSLSLLNYVLRLDRQRRLSSPLYVMLVGLTLQGLSHRGLLRLPRPRRPAAARNSSRCAPYMNSHVRVRDGDSGFNTGKGRMPSISQVLGCTCR